MDFYDYFYKIKKGNQNLKVKDIAKEIGCSDTYLYSILHGKRQAKGIFAVRLYKWSNGEVDYRDEKDK